MNKKLLFISVLVGICIFCVYNFVFSAELNIIDKKRELKCGSALSGNITLNKNYSCIGNAFTLASNTILDCNGYSINGGGTSNGNIGIGINLNNATNVTVKNCSISGFHYGIKLDNSIQNYFYFNNLNNNDINAYESETALSNTWYSSFDYAGNFWSDFENNPGYPNTYMIDGLGNGVDVFPNPTVIDPMASYESGSINYESFVTLQTQTPSSTIRYTLDGSDPNLNSLIYVSPIQITQNTIIKAKAYRFAYAPSNTVTYNYTVVLPGSCGSTIDENFTLTSDINCPNSIPVAFNVGANNLTIDCNGYSINGSSDVNDYGISINSKTGITVKNCKINNFSRGISLGNTTSSTFYNNEFNNTINAYEDETSLGNSWDFESHGNYWYDYDSNTSTPLSYVIAGPGNGVDNFPKPRKMNLSCGDTINQSVTLSNNITCVADQWVSINVNSNNITIDCENHTITGSPGIDDWGINIIGRDNITIRNCNFYDLNFPIYHEDGSYNLIENNTFNATRHGPILRKGSYNIIRNNTILNAELDGIGVVGYLNDGIPSHHNQVTNNTLTNCGSDYASMEISYGWNNLIDGNTIIGTGQYDNSIIMLSAFSNNNMISNNWGTNGDYGFWIAWGSSMNTIYHNYLSNFSYVGIYMDSETSSTTIYNNTILNSAQNNAYQEVPAETVNWDFNGIGNFWGNHNCIDNDNNGICENPYNFPGDADYYPLASPSWNTNTTTENFFDIQFNIKK